MGESETSAEISVGTPCGGWVSSLSTLWTRKLYTSESATVADSSLLAERQPPEQVMANSPIIEKSR